MAFGRFSLSVARPDRGEGRWAVATLRLSGFNLAAMVVVPPFSLSVARPDRGGWRAWPGRRSKLERAARDGMMGGVDGRRRVEGEGMKHLRYWNLCVFLFLGCSCSKHEMTMQTKSNPTPCFENTTWGMSVDALRGVYPDLTEVPGSKEGSAESRMRFSTKHKFMGYDAEYQFELVNGGLDAVDVYIDATESRGREDDVYQRLKAYLTKIYGKPTYSEEDSGASDTEREDVWDYGTLGYIGILKKADDSIELGWIAADVEAP